MNTKGDIGIFACEGGNSFAEKILYHFSEIFKTEGKDSNYKFIKIKETHFANKEIKTEALKSIRGLDLYIIQDTSNKKLPYSVDENLIALKSAIDASRRSGGFYCYFALFPIRSTR